MWGRMPMQYKLRVRAAFALAVMATGTNLIANTTTSDVCHAAALRAAEESGVPFAVLWGITQTETGRQRDDVVEPWPWTLNISGQGYWLETRAAALAMAERSRSQGGISFDLGCFQLNYRWHGRHFASLNQMLDPDIGAAYAAKFLKGLYTEKGDWSAAAGAYHSRTPQYAARYLQRFDRFYQAALDVPVPPSTVTIRQNSFPLLQSGSGYAAPGSLVPVFDGG